MTRRQRGRMPPWQEQAVYLCFGLLLATGAAWLLLDKLVRIAGEFGPEHHPAQQIALIAHGIAAYGFLIVLGTLLPVHITAGWNGKRNRKSGASVLGTLLLLGATALGLYYLGDDRLRASAGFVHWSVGLVATPLLAIHALRGRRSTPRVRGRSN